MPLIFTTLVSFPYVLMSFEGHIHHIMASSASCIRFQRHRQGMARRVWAGEKGVPLSRSYCRFYRSGGWSSFRMVSPWFVVYPPPVLGQSMTNPSITLYCCFIISHLSRYIPVIFPLCKNIYIYPSDPSGICQYNHRKSRCYGNPSWFPKRYCSPS